MCHHCKQLLPTAVLKGCRYRSSKGAVASVESDNLLLELSDSEESASILHQQPPTLSRGARKKATSGSYLSYTKKGDEYICARKYCQNCIRQNYSAVFEGDLCPFCLGACFCTRCQRYDTLNKLKRMYAGCGGNLALLQNESPMEKLALLAEEHGPSTTRTKFKVRGHCNTIDSSSFWM